MKSFKLLWSTSLIVIAVVSLVWCFAGDRLPDTLTRVFGVLDLCAAVVLAFTSVKLRIWEKKK